MVSLRVRIGLGFVVALGLLQDVIRADDQGKGPVQPVKFADRFKGEPVRPKASEPIRFLDSLEQARSEATADKRRILVYFTGPGCAWCRVLEARTFTDAEVVDLSRKYVCVELHTDRDGALADQFHIDSIPRSIVLLPDGQKIDERVGYLPATDYASWLTAALVKTPRREPKPSGKTPPPPVGTSGAEANLAIWFVDNDRTAAGWSDPDAFRHPVLVQLLLANGLKPRIEHMARADFPARWKQAEAVHRLPDLLCPTNWAGTIRELEKEGRLRFVGSERLTARPEDASCQDFFSRFVLLVRGSLHESNGRKAVEMLLRPGPEIELPGPRLTSAAGREEAADTARRAVTAFLSGDSRGVAAVASHRSSQLAECTRPGPSLQEMKAQAGAVELRGNERISVALVESTFESDRFLGGDPIAVVLVREDGHWKVLMICRDSLTVRDAVPALCNIMARMGSSTSDPPEPRLVEPLEGRNVSGEKPYLTWAVTSGGGPLLAQVFAHQFGNSDEKDASWPQARLKVFPAEPRQGKINILSEVVGSHMSWSVWTIGQNGQVAVAPAVHFGVTPVRIK
jgi:Thioredoxin-like